MSSSYLSEDTTSTDILDRVLVKILTCARARNVPYVLHNTLYVPNGSDDRMGPGDCKIRTGETRLALRANLVSPVRILPV